MSQKPSKLLLFHLVENFVVHHSIMIEFLPHQTVEVSSEDAYILENVNTPEDLEKLIRTHEK